MKRPALNQLPGWPRLMSRPLAAAYVGLSPSGFDRWLDDIPSVKIGSKKLYDLDDLNAAIERRKGGETKNDIDRAIEAM